MKPKFSCVTLTLIALCVFTLATRSSCLRFYLHDRERRCFRFESPYDSKVRGHASVTNGKGSAELSVEVRDTSGKTIFHTHNDDPNKSTFSFSTPKYNPAIHADRDLDDIDDYDYDPREFEGWFDVCVVLSVDRTSHDANTRRAVSFWVRPEDFYDEHNDGGANAADSQVHSVRNQLEDVQGVLNHMVGDLVSLQQRERRLVDNHQRTSKRILTLTLLAIFVMLAVTSAQFMHFKTYFKSKKLL